MASVRTVVLSPHPDDAVLSCWHVLAREDDVEVVNIFTAAPSSDGAFPWWDRMTGAGDSAKRMQERLEEDRDALGLVGVASRGLDFLDEQYRTGDQAIEPLAERVGAELPDGATVYAPAGIGGHADHVLVRDAALRAGERATIRLYADLPHAVRFGWPSWVSGEARALDPGAMWELSLRAAGLAFEELEPAIHRLEPEDGQRKLEAIRRYRTQAPALDIMLAGVPEPERMRFEVDWSFAGAGAGSGGAHA